MTALNNGPSVTLPPSGARFGQGAGSGTARQNSNATIGLADASPVPTGKLCRVIEELLGDDPVTLPALERQFLQAPRGAVGQGHLEDPSDHGAVAVDQHRAG